MIWEGSQWTCQRQLQLLQCRSGPAVSPWLPPRLIWPVWTAALRHTFGLIGVESDPLLSAERRSIRVSHFDSPSTLNCQWTWMQCPAPWLTCPAGLYYEHSVPLITSFVRRPPHTVCPQVVTGQSLAAPQIPNQLLISFIGNKSRQSRGQLLKGNCIFSLQKQ